MGLAAIRDQQCPFKVSDELKAPTAQNHVEVAIPADPLRNYRVSASGLGFGSASAQLELADISRASLLVAME